MSPWRYKAREVIREVMATNPPDLKKALRAAYPFGPRQYHPYKVWLEEIRKVLPKPQRISLKYLWKE